jgi:acetoin utilization deacetylase AcuC-like enzyme
MSTGIFFHYQNGERLRDFPQVLGDILNKDNVLFFDAYYPSKPATSFDLKPVPIEVILNVHSLEMVERIKATGSYEGALYSASGTFSAASKVWLGELKNAFVFTGYGDHHAGSNFFGGGCYFNGAAIAIHTLRKKHGGKRFAVIDTDAHHGDGTWELFENDPEVLYICFCPEAAKEKNRNVNIQIPFMPGDEKYLRLVRKAFENEVKAFGPEMIFWNWGYDGTIGEYGDMGLSPNLHLKLATEIKELADTTSMGRIVAILCGGRGRNLAAFLIPGIIKIMTI